MKKLKIPKEFILTGTDNNGYRHRYSVIKNEQFKGIFIKFMGDLGFDEGKIKGEFWVEYDEDDKYIGRELKISEFEDCCRYYDNKGYEIEVFYGNKKIIMVIRTKIRRELLDNLESKSKWIKPIRIKKIKKETGKIVPLQRKVK
jgi:hypothetical protein